MQFHRRSLAVLLLSTLLGSCASISVPVGGFTAPGYEKVRLVFEENFRSRSDHGAAYAAWVGGVKVVDLWGGWRSKDQSLPWEQNTQVVVFSATKGMAALVLAHLHSRGLLDYDRAVASYWPEFAQNGKEAVTVRQLISHEAGIVFLGTPVEGASNLDDQVATATPLWAPGTAQGYHAGSIGFAIAGLVRRCDPGHRSVGQYLDQEILTPLGESGEFRLGQPVGVDRARLAFMTSFSPPEAILHLGEIPPGLRAVIFDGNSLFWKSMGGGGADVNSDEFLVPENPSGNGTTTARALAHAYGELANGGAAWGFGPSTLKAVFGPPEQPSAGTLDRVMNIDAAYGLGFQKPVPGTDWFSDDPGAVGFLGASGALGWADPSRRLGATYVTDRMSPGTQIDDPREKSLRKALIEAIDRQAGAQRS